MSNQVQDPRYSPFIRGSMIKITKLILNPQMILNINLTAWHVWEHVFDFKL